ncbi:hypothetical protein EDO6_00143 [Paenibacillus xylanexedens]|nr:hypothetical protein EDO6_00143 [Paenibacillus xylanexedens]
MLRGNLNFIWIKLARKLLDGRNSVGYDPHFLFEFPLSARNLANALNIRRVIGTTNMQ